MRDVRQETLHVISWINGQRTGKKVKMDKGGKKEIKIKQMCDCGV